MECTMRMRAHVYFLSNLSGATMVVDTVNYQLSTYRLQVAVTLEPNIAQTSDFDHK